MPGRVLPLHCCGDTGTDGTSSVPFGMPKFLAETVGLSAGARAVHSVRLHVIVSLFPECVARVPVSLGGLGVRLCSPSFAFAFATACNRSQPSATVRNRLREGRKALHSGECVWSGPESVSS